MKILIIKTSALGDIVHTYPALGYLREKFPKAQIDWVVEKPFAELVHAHPEINRVFEIESKKWRRSLKCWRKIASFRKELRKESYDVIFDLQGNIKSGLVLFCARGKKRVGFGWSRVPEWPNLLFTNRRISPPKGQTIRDDYLSVVQGFFTDPTPFDPKPILLDSPPLPNISMGTLVCPAAAWDNKRLPLVKLIPFLKRLDRGPYLFAWGDEEERERAEELASHFPGSNLLPRLSLPQLQHLMAQVPLVVAMDSLPLHLAATTGTPTISFFGPSSAQKYAPRGKLHVAYQGCCPYGMHFEKRCPRLRTCETAECIKLLDGVETEKASET